MGDVVRRFLLAFHILLYSGVALADPSKDANPTVDGAVLSQPPVPSDPQATSATYGDWVLVCQRQVSGGERLCEISQSIQVQGQPGPIAQLAVSKSKEAPAPRITTVLPPNILLTDSPRVAVDEKDAEAVALAWQRCLPGGCFADAAIEDAVLAKWRALTDRGRVEFKDGIGRPLVVPFSFRGFAQALDALVKE